MARYRFTHNQHMFEVDIGVDGGSWTFDGEEIDASRIDPASTDMSGAFFVLIDGQERTYEWKKENNIHAVYCDRELVFEVELYEWLDT